ncbi:MAG TPA: HU family DNA-binding protein [Solirubrobacterales bacterium]|nr:HU family DNA-binding protein [Solirubrobacterales bacterium]
MTGQGKAFAATRSPHGRGGHTERVLISPATRSKENRMAITTKDELAKQVAERTGLDASQAKSAVDATIDEITAQLAAGNEVKFTGFGKFSAVARPAREGRNPQTGESMTIAAKTAPKFTPGAELKKAVNG